MQIVLNNVETREPIRIDPVEKMSDEGFYEFCVANPDLRIERNAEGEILIIPPTGLETGFRNNDLAVQLGSWAKRDGHGRAFDPNTEYILPNGAARSPDASWVSQAQLEKPPKAQKRKFPSLCPEFVLELASPLDRLSTLRRKMREWIDNGAQLGWLMDADNRTVFVYRPGREPEERAGIERIEGEGPVVGFVLELSDIWAGI